MADNMPAEGDDEEGFGDFKFATLSSGLAVNPYPINGPDGVDFMNSAFLSRTHSLPSQSNPAKVVENIKILADRNESVPDQPNSAPARASGTQWMKPKGALPLSIFGEEEEEEEEGSGAVGTSSDCATEILSNGDIDSVNTLSNLKTIDGMNGLIASLHKHNDNIGVVNGLKQDSNETNFDSNGNVWNSVAPEVLSNIFISNSGLNGLDLAKPVSLLDSKKPSPSPYASNLDLRELDTNRSATNSDARKTNLDPPGFNFVWSSTGSGVEGLSSTPNDVNGDLEDNDGWEFKAAAAKFEFQHEKAKNDQIKMDNGLTSRSSGSYSALDMFSSDLNQLNLNVNAVNPHTDWLSTSTLGENKSANDNDQLKFTAAETKTEEEPDVAENTSSGVDAQAFSGKSQDNVGMPVSQKGALPLSLFGEEEQAIDDSMDHQDFTAYSPNSDPRDGFKRPASNVPISDIISSLYSQVEEERANDNTLNPQESGLPPKETPIDTDLINSHDNLDDNSWEFKGAFSGIRADNTFVDSIIEADKNNSTQIESNIYVEFYSELKDKLQFVAMCHLDRMKKSQSSSTISSEEAEVQAVDPEIQDLYDKLQHDGLISSEVHIENCSPGGNQLNEFVKAVGQPKFLILESEYNLSKKLLLVHSLALFYYKNTYSETWKFELSIFL